MKNVFECSNPTKNTMIKFDEGFVLKDIFGTYWTLGKPIGQGGFGLIYFGKYFHAIFQLGLLFILIFKAVKGESLLNNSDDAQFAIKIEHVENGPLFCESHFYSNCCKEKDSKN